MRVGFLITDFSLGRGGERTAITIANELSRSFQVDLISLYETQVPSFFEVSNQVRVFSFIKIQGIAKIHRKKSEISLLRNHLKQHKYDLVIGVGSYPSILLGLFSAVAYPSCRFVAWEHSNYDALNWYWKAIRYLSYRKLEGVINLNRTDKAQFGRYFKRVYEIPNPLSFSSDTTSLLNKNRIISAGALEYEKGFDLLLTAFRQLNVHEKNWELVIIGEGSQKVRLEQQICRFGLTSAITIKTPVKDIKAEFLGASLYIMPSRREGFGLVLIEAMECGLPCISFDCPTGPGNIIEHGKNGILVPAGNVHALSEAIAELIQNPSKMKVIADEGKKSVLKYKKELITRMWIDVINELVLKTAGEPA